MQSLEIPEPKKYVTSVRHEDRHRFISFCSANDLFITNTDLKKDYIAALTEAVPRLRRA